MLHANWLDVLDHGDLVLKQFEGKVSIWRCAAVIARHSPNTQVYAVGATYEIRWRLLRMANYDYQAEGVPIDVPLNALDSGLMQLHANITTLWLEIGEQTSKLCFDEARR